MTKVDFQQSLNKFRAFQAGLIFWCAATALVLAEGNLSLENAWVEALKANPELKSHYTRYLASQNTAIQVSALPEPKLTYTRFLSEVQTRTGPQERILQLNQPFPWPGKLALRGGIADKEAEVAFYKYQALQREIFRRVSDLYFDYALLGESVEITRENARYIEQLIPVVEEKVRGGGRLADTLLLQIEKEKTLDVVKSFRERRPILSSSLEMEMGRKPTIENPLPYPALVKKMFPVPAVETLEMKLSCHPRIAAVESTVLSYELKNELAMKSRLPDLSLGASIIDIGNGGDTAVGVVFGFNLPIRRHKYNAEVAQSHLEQKAAKQLRCSVMNQLRTELHREYQLLKDAKRSIVLYRDSLIPKAEQTLAQLEEGYRGNKTGIDEIIDAEKVLLNLRLECLKASAEANKRAAAIRILTEPVKNETIWATPVSLDATPVTSP